MRKPNLKVQSALQTYYFNRFRQKEVEWNKQEDLDKIFKLAKDQGFGHIQSCAGSFWFIYRTSKGKIHHYYTDGTKFPIFEKDFGF